MLNFIYQKFMLHYTRRVKFHTSVEIGNPGEYMSCEWRYDYIRALGKDDVPL